MKIIVFGTGVYWNNRKKYVLDSCDIVCFLDNNPDKWNNEIDGKMIVNPQSIYQYQFDYIVIMCKDEKSVSAQLIALGVSKDKILNWQQLRKTYLNDFWLSYSECREKVYNIVMFSTTLSYNGGTLAAIYAVKALMSKGYKVLLCASALAWAFMGACTNNGKEAIIDVKSYGFVDLERSRIPSKT